MLLPVAKSMRPGYVKKYFRIYREKRLMSVSSPSVVQAAGPEALSHQYGLRCLVGSLRPLNRGFVNPACQAGRKRIRCEMPVQLRTHDCIVGMHLIYPPLPRPLSREGRGGWMAVIQGLGDGICRGCTLFFILTIIFVLVFANVDGVDCRGAADLVADHQQG